MASTLIFARNEQTGENAGWFTSGGGVTGTKTIQQLDPNAGWELVGAGDFNRDGETDLLWRNRGSGDNGVWFMHGETIVGTGGVQSLAADSGWTLAGTGDFNRDGWTDLMWRHGQTGAIGIWFMNGTAVAATAGIESPAIDAGWRLAGTGDFNGDGWSDLLWRHDGSGQNGIWFMNGTAIVGAVGIASVAIDSGWQMASTGDVNGDGRADIVWHQASTGQNGVWLMNGGALVGTTALAQSAPDWDIAAIGATMGTASGVAPDTGVHTAGDNGVTDLFLTGGPGSDRLEGGPGNDQIFGDPPDLAGSGPEASDVLIGNGGDDLLVGGPGNDFLDGGDGNDTMYGDNQEISGSSGNDTMFGGAGNDVMRGGHGTNEMQGGDGDDEIYTSWLPGVTGLGGNGHVDGGAGNDRIFGEQGDDRLEGGAGDDFIRGGEGNDVILGGDGNDTLFGANASAAAGFTTIDGGNGNDVLSGAFGTPQMFGGEGDDRLVLGRFDTAPPGSNPAFNGGGGFDTLDISHRPDFALVGSDPRDIDFIERVDMTDGMTNTLTVDLPGALEALDETDTLIVDGSAGDAVHLVGSWTQNGQQAIGDVTYVRWTLSTANLLLDPDLTVAFG